MIYADDLCNGEYKNQYNEGLKCYYQCGRISLLGLTNEELAGYDLPVIPCDDTTINYCRFKQGHALVEVTRYLFIFLIMRQISLSVII